MDKKYRFLSGLDPSDEQLAALMQVATQEAIARASIAAEKYKKIMQQQLKTSLQEWQRMQHQK